MPWFVSVVFVRFKLANCKADGPAVTLLITMPYLPRHYVVHDCWFSPKLAVRVHSYMHTHV